MLGCMMEFPLTLDVILRRAETIYGRREVVTRLPDKSWHRYTYADMAARAKQLALALSKLGVGAGDRVATLAWNHYRHMEAYFGIPVCGGVLHTVNPRLAADDIAYILNEAQDRVLLIDASLLPVLESVDDQVDLQHVIVTDNQGSLPAGKLDYESLLAEQDPAEFQWPSLDERQAVSMCYTSGTTGRPKGVLYSHRSICLHSLGAALTCAFEVWESDVFLPVVPMFHVHAWGIPFIAPMMGAKLVLPGPDLSPEMLADAFEKERVTCTAGVPTVWRALLEHLDEFPDRYDLASLRKVFVGGAALPSSLMTAFEERHGLRLIHAWGMTETTPVGAASYLRPWEHEHSVADQISHRARQGTPIPFVEIRARGDDGLTPWDGVTMGELEVRGPWIIGEYYQRPDAADRFTDDGWFRTGDVVAIRVDGSIKIEDRAKDLIKSGGEWISSVELENALMAHPAVAEAAVIAIPHEKWDERPLAVAVFREGSAATVDELKEHLATRVAKWWLPESIEVVASLPKTAVGKFDKQALREQFAAQKPS